MRVLILAGPGQTPEAMAKAVAQGVQNEGGQVERAPLVSEGPRGLAAYRLVCLGVNARGLFGRGIGDEVEEALKNLRGLGGRHVAAFVCRNGIGGAGALRQLMAALEREGAFIRDFELVKSAAEGEAFGRRLRRLLND